MSEGASLLDEFKVKLTGQDNQPKNKKRLLVIIPAAVFILLLILGSIFFIFEAKYANRFFPGTHIGNISVGGLSKDQAFNLIDQVTADIEQNGVKIIYEKNKTVNFERFTVLFLKRPGYTDI